MQSVQEVSRLRVIGRSKCGSSKCGSFKVHPTVNGRACSCAHELTRAFSALVEGSIPSGQAISRAYRESCCEQGVQRAGLPLPIQSTVVCQERNTVGQRPHQPRPQPPAAAAKLGAALRARTQDSRQKNFERENGALCCTVRRRASAPGRGRRPKSNHSKYGAPCFGGDRAPCFGGDH